MAEDANEDQSPFVEALREAHASEPRDFMRCLHAMLYARLSATSGHAEQASPVSTSAVSGSPDGSPHGRRSSLDSPRTRSQPPIGTVAPTSKGDAGLVTAATVRGVVSILDPQRPADDVREVLVRGFAGAYTAKAVPWQTRKSATGGSVLQTHKSATGGSVLAPPLDTATIRIDKLIANLRPSFPRWAGGKPQDLDTLLALCQQQ